MMPDRGARFHGLFLMAYDAKMNKALSDKILNIDGLL